MLQPHRAPRIRLAFGLLLLLGFAASTVHTEAAQHRTTNFVTIAPTEAIAKQVGEAAEYFRRELALEWTGQIMPNWTKPCPIKVKVGNIGAGGATTFSFDRGEVFGWKMNVQGTLERILDSVIPHEVSHTVFACHFRRPLPRWADEGAATLTEHESEKNRQSKLLGQVIRTSRRIPLRKLLAMTEYPSDMKDVLTLYAEGYALADLLVQERGKATYLRFLEDAHKRGWDFAISKHYTYKSVDDLERRWSDWVIAGSPEIVPDGQMLASNSRSPLDARGQSPNIAGQMAGRPMTNRENDLALGQPSDFGTPGSQRQDGQLAFNDTREPRRLDRSRLTRPVHQVPLATAENSQPYQAFRRRDLIAEVN